MQNSGKTRSPLVAIEQQRHVLPVAIEQRLPSKVGLDQRQGSGVGMEQIGRWLGIERGDSNRPGELGLGLGLMIEGESSM